ncbi:MAG: hypothetical protein JW745_08350 [Sedimentisphaerales bacterium]|nr:hypothetical protein [Sedimentisphaerales bacterium]MBN2843070.1 hypothetical protein [Sedimentisphaerales bacterium]
MPENIYQRLMSYLSAQRMATVGNIAIYLETSVEDTISLIQDLQVNDIARLVTAENNCSGGCGSCNSANHKPTAYDENTVAVSMVKSLEAADLAK